MNEYILNTFKFIVELTRVLFIAFFSHRYMWVLVFLRACTITFDIFYFDVRVFFFVKLSNVIVVNTNISAKVFFIFLAAFLYFFDIFPILIWLDCLILLIPNSEFSLFLKVDKMSITQSHQRFLVYIIKSLIVWTREEKFFYSKN